MLTVKYASPILGDIEIDIRRATVRDDLNFHVMHGQLMEGVKEGEWGMWELFAELVSRSVRSVNLPFDVVALRSAGKAALDAAYNQFLDLDKELKDRWVSANQRLNKPIDETLTPEPLPENADPN